MSLQFHCLIMSHSISAYSHAGYRPAPTQRTRPQILRNAGAVGTRRVWGFTPFAVGAAGASKHPPSPRASSGQMESDRRPAGHGKRVTLLRHLVRVRKKARWAIYLHLADVSRRMFGCVFMIFLHPSTDKTTRLHICHTLLKS